MSRHSYKVRITLSEECTLADSVAWIVDTSPERYAYVYEIGKIEEKPHVHAYILSEGKVKTLRSQLRTLAGPGKCKFSFVETDETPPELPLAFLAYFLKAGEPVIHGIDRGEWNEVVEYDAKVKTELKAKREAKKSAYQQLCTIVEQLQEKYDTDRKGRILKLNDVVSCVLAFYQNRKSMFSSSMVKTAVETLSLKYVPSYRQTYLEKLYDSLACRNPSLNQQVCQGDEGKELLEEIEKISRDVIYAQAKRNSESPKSEAINMLNEDYSGGSESNSEKDLEIPLFVLEPEKREKIKFRKVIPKVPRNLS